MLKNYLAGLRRARNMTSQQAAAQLGSGWTVNNGALQKDFKFNNFVESSNFMLRYTEHCQKVGQAPQWSNVYN